MNSSGFLGFDDPEVNDADAPLEQVSRLRSEFGKVNGLIKKWVLS